MHSIQFHKYLFSIYHKPGSKLAAKDKMMNKALFLPSRRYSVLDIFFIFILLFKILGKLNQRLVNFFCKKSDNKYFMLCGPHSICTRFGPWTSVCQPLD